MMSKNNGFTLIELAIVIVIAAILASVAIPIYSGLVDDAKWTEAKNSVASLKNAIIIKRVRWGGQLIELGVANGVRTQVSQSICNDIGIYYDSLTTQYFEATNYYLTIDTSSNPDSFTLEINAPGGQGEGGPAGTGTYASATDTYTGVLQ